MGRRQFLSDVPSLARAHPDLTPEDWFAGSDHKPSKKLRVTPPQISRDDATQKQEIAVDIGSPLAEFLRAALPEKEQFIAGWLRSLASPLVCITSLEDVRSIDAEDIDQLPVPPCVRQLFRREHAKESAEAAEQQAVLELSTARSHNFLSKLRDRNHQPPIAGSRYFQDFKNYRLILTNEEIAAGVRILAHRLETWCRGERVVLVGILNGAFMLMSDLCRAISRPYSVYFVDATSYKNDQQQTSADVLSGFSSSKFIDPVTKAPHKIALVDELLDNGRTMHDMKLHFLEKLKESHTESDILTVCLFSKKRERALPDVDITGIPNLPDLWLLGYGLDDRGTKRGWTELFAVPKVKIVSTIEEDEVARLVSILDDDGVLTKPLLFSGFELSFKNKCRYRVSGLDIHGGHERNMMRLQESKAKVESKSDIQRILQEVAPTVKGKYEHELHFAFIAANQSLVTEDEIFYGNNRIYADLRCSLRKQIQASAQRCGVRGFDDSS